MIHYFDTSALLKKYFQEEGTETVRSLFDDLSLIPFTSTLTEVEGCHGIFRKQQEGRISDREIKKIFRQFQKDMKGFHLIRFGPEVVRRAQKIIREKILKTLDAIHIASALVLKRKSNLLIHFVSSDEQQNRVAESCGLKIVNPL